MDKLNVLPRLHQLTADLTPKEQISEKDLRLLQRKLAEQLIFNPDFIIAGSSIHQSSFQKNKIIGSPGEFTDIDLVFDNNEPKDVAPALAFRRDTSIRNNLLGNSVADWANGMAPSETIGPFLHKNGLEFYFDFFSAVKMAQVFITGTSYPVLIVPIRGIITAKKNYRIAAGSVWIASNFITGKPAQLGYYTGLKIKGGTLDFELAASESGENLYSNATSLVKLHIDLDHNELPKHSPDAGFDATKSTVHLPESMDFEYSLISSELKAGGASSEIFGCETTMHFGNGKPVWEPLLQQILVPFEVTSTGREPRIFSARRSRSKLATISSAAEITKSSGWLLPAAKIDPSLLGKASGTGAICINLKPGLKAIWKGLKGGACVLNNPFIIAEPGMITVIDFTAENLYGKQRWKLWENEKPAPDSPVIYSEINLALAASFPFAFISNSTGSEIVSFLNSFKAEMNKPVASNGNPFRIESAIGLAMISQVGTVFKGMLLDTNLWFDIKADGSTVTNPEGYKKNSIALRNMLFNITAPYSFFILGTLEDEDKMTEGIVTMKFGISYLLPTLPDPYVSNYNPRSRNKSRSEYTQTNIVLALASFVKWPDQKSPYLYFDFAAYDHPYLPPPPQEIPIKVETIDNIKIKNFRNAGNAFGNNLVRENFAEAPISINDLIPSKNPQSLISTKQELTNLIRTTIDSGHIYNLISQTQQGKDNAELHEIVDKIQKASHAAQQVLDSPPATAMSKSVLAASSREQDDVVLNRLAGADFFTLLDVSSNADQMGVSFGNPIRVERQENGDYKLNMQNVRGDSSEEESILPFGISNLDVVSPGTRLRSVTLPQISWEPLFNAPLEKEAPDPFKNIAELLRNAIQLLSDYAVASLPANPLAGYETLINTIVDGYLAILSTGTDSITVLPGLMIYDNDGIPTKFSSESQHRVPISPLPVIEHFIQEYHNDLDSKDLHATFNLPFALIASADFSRDYNTDKDGTAAQLSFHRPWFEELRGGLQIKAIGGDRKISGTPGSGLPPAKYKSFKGWTFQLSDNIKWFLFGKPTTGSTLGEIVRDIFNLEFDQGMAQAKVPVEKMEFSGYGASMFSNWIDSGAAISAVSQAKFDVMMGRTAHEVVQVRSVMYMATGCVKVVRTITLMRSPNGFVYRSDSGWKAESDAFYDCSYNIDFGVMPQTTIENPYQFHPGGVLGVSNVREIKDYPAGGVFHSSFSLNESGIAGKATEAQWHTKLTFKTLDDQLEVDLRAVVFDADVHIEDVKTGGTKDDVKGGYRVVTKKMLGYVQVAPTAIMIPPKILAKLLKDQNGSLGGPVDCIIDIAGNDQRMRIARVDLSPAKDAAGNDIFCTAARGSLLLPKDGSWSVVKHIRDSGDVKPVEEGQLVPLIKSTTEATYRIANPADVVLQSAAGINYGILQSTGTQKLLFNIPQFLPPASNGGKKQLLSANTYFADAYKLLNAKGIFPNIINALTLTNDQKAVDIIGDGMMKLLDAANKPFDIKIEDLLPIDDYKYIFVHEPDVVKIYAEYKNGKGNGKLALGINSAGAIKDNWKAAMSNICVAVDLGKDPAFIKILYVDGDFNAGSGTDAKYGGPKLHFGTALEPMVEILEVLALLTGNDFDSGMNVGMSNSPDNWEYKFNTSKEIPVIKFPPAETPNPPLTLEAGLKVGFYFNEVINISEELKTNLPACGAYIEFYAKLSVMCFTVSVASVYAVGQANLRICGDTKEGLIVYMKFGFGVEIVVGYPVVGNAQVLFMASVAMTLGTKALDVAAGLLFRGSAEICGGLVSVCIQIEALGIIHKETSGPCYCTVQVNFSIDICILWVIDIDFHDSWSESRQIA